MDTVTVPRAFQGITHLGQPVRVFSPWRNALVYLAIPVMWLALVVSLWRVDQSDGTRFPGWLWAMLGLWMLIAAGLGWWGLRRLRIWSVVYERGFAHTRGRTVGAWRWEDVARVTVIPARYGCKHRVATVSGDRLIFDGSPDYAGQMVRDRSYPFRRQRLGERFDRGETVDFGPLAVSRSDGIRSGSRAFAWDQIRSLRVPGSLVLSTRDDSFLHASGGNCALSSVPDPDVLLDLAAGMGVEASRESVTELP